MTVKKILFPDYAIDFHDDGLCIGFVDEEWQFICITAVLFPLCNSRELDQKLQTDSGGQRLRVLGPLLIHRRGHKADGLPQADYEDFCLELTRPDVHSLPECLLLNRGERLVQEHHLVIYNHQEVLGCRLLPGNDLPSNHLHGDPVFSCDAEKVAVLKAIQNSVEQQPDLSVSVDPKMTPRGMFSFQNLFINSALCLRPASSICSRFLVIGKWLGRSLRFSHGVCQVEAKYRSLQCLITNPERKGEAKRKTMSISRDESRRIGNLLTFLLMDLLLGVLLMCWINLNHFPDQWADRVIVSANKTAGSLQQLLKWLMGAPAGLKLNSALAHFLGQFFLYHVYLWIGYLAVIKPLLGWIIWGVSLTGCIGVSVILAITSDMISMLTLHMYCFYVYAARIYSLQLAGLVSLFRLFRGKKWNVLRKRVDTCHYDVDQLFIGTLLFTILLFLLPTTALYYAVFTMLRLSVIMLKVVLTKTVDLLNAVPMYTIFSWLTGAECVVGSVACKELRHSARTTSKTFIMQVNYMGLLERLCYPISTGQSESANSSPVSVSLVSDIIAGRLIHPSKLKPCFQQNGRE